MNGEYFRWLVRFYVNFSNEQRWGVQGFCIEPAAGLGRLGGWRVEKGNEGWHRGVEKHTKSAPGVKNIKNLQRGARYLEGNYSPSDNRKYFITRDESLGGDEPLLFVRLNVRLQDLFDNQLAGKPTR